MVDRRTLLTRIVAGFGVLAAAGFSVPFLRSFAPSFRNEIILDVDIARLVPGKPMRVVWLGRPVFIVKRNPEDSMAYLSDKGLEDPGSTASIQPDYATNDHRSRKPDVLLVYANCTHLGCEVEANEKGGFDCPCHQSEFDSAGRVFAGSAAKSNLQVPEYQYTGRQVVRLIHSS